jgi:hypothetical protein
MFDDDGLEIQMMGIDDEEQAIAALEAAGIAGAARIPGAMSRRRRMGEREEEQRNEQPTEPPESLWRFAMDNAASYQPKWGSSTQHRGKMRVGQDIEVGSGDLQNVARTEDGVTEGRAVRASEPLPRAAHRSQRENSDSPGQVDRQRKVYGFRVVFDHPYRDVGMSLGDYYLIGLTTSSFSAFGERNGLLQSPYFWGIEDGGSCFEGARRRRGARPGAGSTNYGMETSSRDAPRNTDSVLFGSQETVTVIVDLENSTMSFWRDGDFIGTLVRNLPRSGYLYPVVVPFNAGVTFAITGMDGSPLPCVKNFNALRKEKLEQEANRRRQELVEQRSVLIQNGKLSKNVITVLKNIFFSYTGRDDGPSPSEPLLDVVTASRLWYRCGLMLTELAILAEEKAAETANGAVYDTIISADDFIECMSNMVEEEEAVSIEPSEDGVITFEVGDKVELVDSYTKYGDASGGPLQPGDRGTVIEVKRGPGVEIQAVCVSSNANQWWYQPQAILTERSGLIESPSVWFLHKALRTHGYDQSTLDPLRGRPLNTTFWEVGDIVVPLSQKKSKESEISTVSPRCFGRIAAESRKLSTSASSRPRGRKADTVLVEFIDPEFGIATGVMNALEDSLDAAVEVRQVPIDRLQFGSGEFVQFDVFKPNEGEDKKPTTENILYAEQCTPVVVNSKLRAEIEGVSCLDPASIQSVANMCDKQPSLCSSAFSSGLCDAILSGLTLAEEATKKGKVTDRMGVAVSSLGLLSSILCKGLLSTDTEPASTEEDSEMCQDDEMNLSAILSEASFPAYDRSAVSESRRSSSNHPLFDPLEMLASRRLNLSRARGTMFRERARHQNSTNARSSSDGLNSDGNVLPDTRVAIQNGLLRNNLPWLKACLHVPLEQSKAKSGSESLLSRMINDRDEHGMSLLLLAVTFGCSKEIVHHLITSEANITKTEITSAAVSNQPHLLSMLLQHSICPNELIESLRVSPEVAAVFEAAKAKQKLQEEALHRKAEGFLTTFVVSLCRLANTCSSKSARIQRFGQGAWRALVGNVLLRALHESQRKAQATSSPRRRKHAGSTHHFSDPDSERLSLSHSAPWSTGDSEVFASASAMSPNHGVLLGLPAHFFNEGFLAGLPEDREQRLSVILTFIESLLWSNDEDSVATGLTVLYRLLKGISIADLSYEMERYGLKDLMSAHELIAERHLADIRSRLKNVKAIENDSDSASADDGARTNKKRPRQQVASSTASTADGVVMCPKDHVAEIHLTKHSSFRCDLCGKSVQRDRPMHGCRECDWDACEACTDQVEGGIVKWETIIDLAVNCRKLLEETNDDNDRMNVDEVYDDSSKAPFRPDFSDLVLRLRLRDNSALPDLASKMATSDHMTNHEFVSFILPALHAALVDKQGTSGSDDFCLKALEALTDFVESSTNSEVKGDDDSRMAVEEIPTERPDASDAYQQAPTIVANRIPSIGLRRIQNILSFSENMSVLHVLWDKKKGSTPSLSGSRLRSLTKPVQLNIIPWSPSHAGSQSTPVIEMTVFVEPLLSVSALGRHVVLAGRIENETYLSFCRSLSTSKAVIVERPADSGIMETSQWRIGQVTGFDEDTGAHILCYPSRTPNEMKRGMKQHSDGAIPFDFVKFDGEEKNVVLAAREYVILRRNDLKSPRRAKAIKCAVTQSPSVDRDGSVAEFPPHAIPAGIRVEANCVSPDPSAWLPCTVVARYVNKKDIFYDIVSDKGEVFREVRKEQLRGYQTSTITDASMNDDNESHRNLRDSLDPGQARNLLRRSGGALPFPFFRMSRNESDQRIGEQPRTESRPTPESGILKRTWSAISPLNEMSPLDIPSVPASQDKQKVVIESITKTWNCLIGEETMEVSASEASFELPPELCVEFTAHDKLPPTGSCGDETVIHMLHRLLQRSDESRNDGGILRKKHRLYYIVHCEAEPNSRMPTHNSSSQAGGMSVASLPHEKSSHSVAAGSLKSDRYEGRRKTFVHDPFDTETLGISEGLDSTSLQCMEVMNALATCAEEAGANFRDRPDWNEDPSERVEKTSDLLSSFENESLTRKLANQLEDPLMVVSGVLPEWCLAAPSLAPLVFSYASRRQLLLRTAFGVSRSTLKQQEAKVGVGPLKQRMAVLRGRAVQLMGEAFSGEAEDPTVLQLQADELYGMEEALASRVTAAFRGQRWEERAIQCVKAVVRRERLLIDATNLVERYARDKRMCHRRLEVRFEGESGFDAASGTEAGVTRGFYADVAEALLSSEHVSPLNCPVSCFELPWKSVSDGPMDGLVSNMECRLPLWIPDMDSTHQVVIPTPRANQNSTLGVFPRPLLPYDALLPLVLERFRFMGRLFAAAMRDGLMFPLQLSTSFLKLVQMSSDRPSAAAAAMPPAESNATGNTFVESSLSPTCRAISLTSDDLPRPGFLGGEVYAVEKYICAALDKIDEAEPPLSPLEAEEQRQKVATDPQFARVALGKSYDCSFEEYFEDRVFVDPLSPTQDEDSAPLCASGHLRQVTIHNVREWTMLAKRFILHDGVMEQACAFRQGIDDFFSSDYLRIFTAVELQRDVCGGGDKVDRWTEDDIRGLLKFDSGRGVTEALVAVAAMGGEGGASLNRRFGPSSSTIGFLVKTLLESSPTQRRQFLSFVTSVPIVTPGKIEVVPMVSPSGEFLPVREGCLPRANTCARRLYLPRFDDYDTFNRVLHAVIREESKFKGFYEWRG